MMSNWLFTGIVAAAFVIAYLIDKSGILAAYYWH